MEQRLLVISPIRNEAAHFERVAQGMAAQTRRPDMWVVVDDHSTDATPQLLAKLAGQLDFMRVIDGPPPLGNLAPKDRLAVALPPRAFNRGLHSTDWRSFTHIAKLDGDVELPPRYFEQLLAEFAGDASLGIAGGLLREREGEQWGKKNPVNHYHVRGGLKCYTRECLETIGGIQERLAWDAIDELYARMRGYTTRTVPELVAWHHRQTGSADGLLRGRARHGQCAHIVHFTLPWVSARAFKVARERPRGLSGVAFLYGYLRAAATRVPQVDDPELRAFVRSELRHREHAQLRQLAARGRGLLAFAGRTS